MVIDMENDEISKGITDKKALFYDGLYYSVNIIRRLYDDLIERLRILSEFQFENPDVDSEFAITEAWSIIDSLYRLRKLLEDTPGLKQNDENLRLFYQRTKCLKELRDSIQHLDEHINKYIPDKIPALGRLSWVYVVNEKRYKACMLVPGDIQPDLKLMPSHMGQRMKNPIDFVTLTSNNSVCLTQMINALDELIPWLNDKLNNNFSRKHQMAVMCFGISTNYNIY